MWKRFGLWGFADLTDNVNRLILRLVIGAGHDFGEQPHRHELNARKDQQHGQKEKRAVGNRLMPKEPLVRQIRGNQKPDKSHRHANEAEHLQRARRITQQEFYEEEIENDSERSR